MGRPPDAPATGLPGRRDPAARGWPFVPRTRHRPRSTRGHRQGAGPSRPGPVAHSVRGRRAARARGDDRMTTEDRDLEAAMTGLLTSAPLTLAPDVLVEVGLADRYARMASPIGALV